MSATAIQVGREFSVTCTDSGAKLRVRCESLDQRNWSRVAAGEYLDGVRAGKSCFIKQYLDRTGNMHEKHWDYEAEGAQVAARVLKGVARVPELYGRNTSLCINVFEYIEVDSVDELLRLDESRFRQCVLPVIRQMAVVLDRLQALDIKHDLQDLPLKQRSYGSGSNAVSFKGFEIRNAGVEPEVVTIVGAEELILFDFVRPYRAPIEEVAAKLFVSVGLLNWGSPIGRFLRGPDQSLLQSSKEILGPWLDPVAISAELDLQRRFRTGEFKGAGGFEVLLKRIGVDILGRWYLRRLCSWCGNNL